MKLLSTYFAKGLEFPLLLLPVVTEERFPTTDGDETVANASKRDLYTAMMRCGWKLHLGAPGDEVASLIADIDQTMARKRSVPLVT